MTNRLCAWDLEIAAIIPDDRGVNWSDYRPYGITCAAAWLWPEQEIILWHGEYGDRMPPDSCGDMGLFLRTQQAKGYDVVTWNGGYFDFDVLAEECRPEDFDNIVELALRHVDPGLQMMRELGFMCGLAAAAQGCGLGGKTMKGKDAPLKWKGTRAQQDEVLEYVGHDARLTGQVYLHIMRNGNLPYISKRSGQLEQWVPRVWREGNRLLTVEEVGMLNPPANRPWKTYEEATAWMARD